MLIRAHAVPMLASGLSPMQERLLRSEKLVRLVSAPTGSGKSYAFMRAVLDEEARVLFIVPTKRLLQNLIEDARGQAREKLGERGWAERQIEAWIEERILEWSGNQVGAAREGLPAVRVRQLLNVGAPSDAGVVFAIPEVVVSMISGVRVRGAGAINPFFYLRAFDHLVFDEFHTIDDRSFGLAALFALLAVEERQGKVSFLSATPIDVTKVLERLGVGSGDIEQISEEVVTGHPPDHRPIHGDVTLGWSESSIVEALSCNLETVQASISEGGTVIVIYDSLQRLKVEEPAIRAMLSGIGVRDENVLSINSIDDSRRKPGEPRRGRPYTDPREYAVLLCTSSVEVGVTFHSTLMVMDPGHRLASFVQRVGRVSRGMRNGRVIVSIPEGRRNRHAWTRNIAAMIERSDAIDVRTFTAEILRDARRRLEPTRRETKTGPTAEGSAVPFFGRASWRGAFWAALFVVAVQRTRMGVQRGARNRLHGLSPGIVEFVNAKITEILSVREVNDCLPLRAQPHKAWVDALFRMALAYRDIGATIEVVDPNGDRRTVQESFLRRTTDVLDRFVEEYEDGARVVRLLRCGLDEEIRLGRQGRGAGRLSLHIRSPVDEGSFSVSIRESDRGTERLNTRLVREWRHRFDRFIPVQGEGSDDPRRRVVAAATALVERLGAPPLEEDYDDHGEVGAPA